MKTEQEQIIEVENFFKKAFIADNATLIPVDDEMRDRIKIRSIVKLETADRGSFYVSMLTIGEVEK